MNELELSEEQVLSMVEKSLRVPTTFKTMPAVLASDSYGDFKHRTWVFSNENNEMIGSIERYWGGLKMICSVLGGSPRTSFFTEDGVRTTNKGLKAENSRGE